MEKVTRLRPYAGREKSPEPLDVTIETGVPVPINIMPKKYGFDRLEVGINNLLIKNREAPIVRRALLDHKKKHPERKFTVRKSPTGVRVWRTE